MWKLLTDAVAKVVPFAGPTTALHIDPEELEKLQLAEQTFDATIAEFERRRELEKMGDGDAEPLASDRGGGGTDVDSIAKNIRDDECFEMKGGLHGLMDSCG